MFAVSQSGWLLSRQSTVPWQSLLPVDSAVIKPICSLDHRITEWIGLERALGASSPTKPRPQLCLHPLLPSCCSILAPLGFVGISRSWGVHMQTLNCSQPQDKGVGVSGKVALATAETENCAPVNSCNVKTSLSSPSHLTPLNPRCWGGSWSGLLGFELGLTLCLVCSAHCHSCK